MIGSTSDLRRKSRWKAWLEEVRISKQDAYGAISIFNKYGESKVNFTDSLTVLFELSKPSNDPEKVALVEQKLPVRFGVPW